MRRVASLHEVLFDVLVDSGINENLIFVGGLDVDKMTAKCSALHFRLTPGQ